MLCFVFAGCHNRKNTSETEWGFHKHKHLSSYTMWKERERRASTGKEISTLLNAEQLQKNRYYMSSIIDIIGFLGENQLPLPGKLDAFDNMAEGGRVFLSLLDYTIKKDPWRSKKTSLKCHLYQSWYSKWAHKFTKWCGDWSSRGRSGKLLFHISHYWNGWCPDIKDP